MEIEIHPRKGVGDIHFGDARNNIRKIFKEEPVSFKKNPWSTTLTDGYDQVGIQFFYNENDQLNFIEILPECKAYLFGIKLWSCGLKKLLDELNVRGYSPNIDDIDGNYIFDELGFGIHREGRRIQSCFLFKSDSYSDYLGEEMQRAEEFYAKR